MQRVNSDGKSQSNSVTAQPTPEKWDSSSKTYTSGHDINLTLLIHHCFPQTLVLRNIAVKSGALLPLDQEIKNKRCR